MDQILSKAGSYWFNQRAGKELDSVNTEINTISNTIENGSKWLVGKIKGNIQKTLPELLREYDMAIGIFPQEATRYDLDEKTGYLTVYVPSVCEVVYKDSGATLRFSSTVSGYLEKGGKFTNIEGMKTKVTMIWVKVTSITTTTTTTQAQGEEEKLLHFSARLIKKTKTRDAYEVLRQGVAVHKF